MWIKEFFVLYLCLCYVSCAKILFVSITPSPSHQKPFQEIWKALALRGHEVHVVTPNPLVNSTIPNLKQYDISAVYSWAAEMNKKFKQRVKFSLQKPTFFDTFTKEFLVARGWHAVNEYALTLPEFSKLINAQPKLRFDSVIVEWLYPTMAALGGYYEAPLIGICSLGAATNGLDAIGNVLNPVVTPDQNVPIGRSNFSFRDRLLSIFYSIWIRIYYHWHILPMEDKTVRKYLGNNLPYLGQIERNVSLLLLNRNQISHRIMPVVPGVIEFGGLNYNRAVQTLNPDLQDFLDKSNNGVIYFSLGAAIKLVDFLSPDQVQIFKSVFNKLPYNVLWKFENDTMESKPENIFVSKWLNQSVVLDHPNVKLFITQGGLQSTEETIAAHKPIIGIPFHSDQTTNVDTCVQYGMGKMIELEDLTAEKLRSYILEIINNPSYAENAKKLDELMKDQPQDGLEKAIWWIEYVIRHKGAKHLRSTAVDLPWWKYLMLDIFAFISAIFLAIVLILYYSFKFIVQLGSKLFRKNDNSTKKKSE